MPNQPKVAKAEVPCAVANESSPMSRTSVRAALSDDGDSLLSRIFYAAVAAVPTIVLLRQITEPFEAASDIGSVTLDVAIGYLAGWIFYYLTVWRPRAEKRDRILRLVARDAVALAGTAGGFLGHLRVVAGNALPADPVSRTHFKSVAATLMPSANVTMVTPSGSRSTLAGALDYASYRQEQLAAKIERWSDLLSVDLLELIHGVLDVPILRPTVRSTLHVQMTPFGGLSGELVKWFEASDALRLYVATVLSDDLQRAGYDPAGVAAGRLLEDQGPTK